MTVDASKAPLPPLWWWSWFRCGRDPRMRQCGNQTHEADATTSTKAVLALRLLAANCRANVLARLTAAITRRMLPFRDGLAVVGTVGCSSCSVVCI